MITVTLKPSPYLQTLADTGAVDTLPTGTVTLPGIPTAGHHLTIRGRQWVVDSINWTADTETVEIVLS
jgi:hypothetical protein